MSKREVPHAKRLCRRSSSHIYLLNDVDVELFGKKDEFGGFCMLQMSNEWSKSGPKRGQKGVFYWVWQIASLFMNIFIIMNSLGGWVFMIWILWEVEYSWYEYSEKLVFIFIIHEYIIIHAQDWSSHDKVRGPALLQAVHSGRSRLLTRVWESHTLCGFPTRSEELPPRPA